MDTKNRLIKTDTLGFDTAWFALKERGRLRRGETVLILGANGAVGLAAIKLAKVFGAKVLAAVSSLPAGDIALDAGADEIIDLSVKDLDNRLRDQVHMFNNGCGANIILDMLSDRFTPAALRALDWCGRLVVIGFAAGEIPMVKLNYLLFRNIEVTGLQVSDYRIRTPELMYECYNKLFELYEAGKITPPRYEVLPLSEAALALTRVRNRSASHRLVLTPKNEAFV